MNNINKSIIAIAIMVLLCASMIPMTATSTTPNYINGKPIYIQSASGTYATMYSVRANVSDIIYINWTKGVVGSSEELYISIYTIIASQEWSNLTERNDTGVGTVPIHGYQESFFTGSSAPMSSYVISPATGSYDVYVWTTGLTFKSTVYINVTHYQETPLNLIPIYNLINGLNQSINNLNKTVQGLNNNNTIIYNDILDINNQIHNLKSDIENNSVNTTYIQEYIISLQGQIDKIRSDISSLNMTTNITNNQINTTNLTKINQTLESLSSSLNSINNTIKNLKIPPDTQSDIGKLKAENKQLQAELTSLQKNVSLINPINKTTYINTTNNNTKKISESGNVVGIGAVSGAVVGGIIGCAGGVVMSRRKNEPPSEPVTEYEDITHKTEPDVKIKEPEKPKDDTIDDILGKLKPEDKSNIKSKNADAEVDTVPIKPVKDRPAQKLTIGGKTYTESDILSRLTSLPRGLPSEFFGKDISELAGILMTVKYINNEDGEVVFLYNKKKYYGNPDNVGTYMQRFK